MKEVGGSIVYKRLRAPSEDGQVFVDPVVASKSSWLARNVALHRGNDCDLHGCRLAELQTAARRQLLASARRYTAAYRSPPDQPADPDAPMILVGHQPELVHPGVWYKNFVLSELAAQASAHAVNLLVDNDIARGTTLRVPGGTVERPMVFSVPLDRSTDAIPHEERDVRDPALFESAGRRVAEVLRPLIARPLIERLWPLAVEASRQGGNFGQAIARARHILEGEWGLRTLEVPMSHVCDQWPFRWFAAHILCQADHLRDVHNGLLTAYRTIHGIRSHTHPVPDLATRDGWTEVPFWLWTAAEPVRRRAFVRIAGSTVEATDFHGVRLVLPLHRDGDAGPCVDRLGELHRAGVRLRPRALITTMYARLVLSDVFIHGIGGAKYDQLTDAIVRRFFGLEPPEYLTVSATKKLPLARATVEPADVLRIDRLFRELQYHPERYVEATPAAAALKAEKRRWVETLMPRGQRRERHRNIARINAALQQPLESLRQKLVRERQDLRAALGRRSILEARDYAFCLFPEKSLHPSLLALARQ